MKTNLPEAIAIIKQGGIAIFPTDTAFGMGCRIDDATAVRRLFAIKQRLETQAMPILIDSIAMGEAYMQSIPEDARDLMQTYWPGALTIILQCKREKVLPVVRGGGTTLGIRMPNHPIPLAIIEAIGVPIIGTSANFHTKPTVYEAMVLDQELIQEVDVVISGECQVKQASTVIDCSRRPWKILRPGAVSIDKNW